MQRSVVRVRLGTAADLSFCADFAAADGAGDRADWLATFRRTIADGRWRVLFVATWDDEVVGYARAVHLDSAPDVDHALPAGWYLLGVVVAPAFRRRGIGGQLTVARLDWLRSRGRYAYFFTGVENVASRELHTQLGFEQLAGSVSIVSADGSGAVTIQTAYRIDLGESAYGVDVT